MLDTRSKLDERDEDQIEKYHTEEELIRKYGIPRDEVTVKEHISRAIKRNLWCSGDRVIHFITSLIPILGWLPKYKIKQDLFSDIIAGFTVAMVHLPQGMAYGMLASLPPIHGLYVSFFPVIMYALLGTSRQVSLGTFAVVCIMVGEVVDKHVPDSFCEGLSSPPSEMTTTNNPMTFSSQTTTESDLEICEDIYLQRKIEIAVALSLAVGVIQILMSLLHMGIVTIYLSDNLVSGFTCGSAFHVLTSQVPKLLGISVPKYSGALSLIYTYIDLFEHITMINWATVIVSTLCIIFLLFGKEINARYHKKLPMPLPWEFVVVIITTVASHYGLLYENHDVSVVGDIPTGLRVTIPNGPDIGAVMVEAIPIAIVAYAIEISLGMMFATRYGYDVDSNQELVALGSANVFGSFFSCFPCAASLSRSVIWDEVGGKTQITGLVSSSLILIILLWIGPLFESLPQASLAAIIVVNLKRLLRQFDRIPSYWRINKLDAFTWIVTWTAVVLLGVDIGLFVGVGFELITVVCNTQVANGAVLAEVHTTGNYKNVKHYRTRKENDSNILVFRYQGPLYFANYERFKNQISAALGFDPSKLKRDQIKPEDDKFENKANEDCEKGVRNTAFVDEKCDTTVTDLDSGINSSSERPRVEDNASSSASGGETEKNRLTEITSVILDMTSCSFVDNDGAKAIKSLFLSLRALDVTVSLVACNDGVQRAICTLCKETRPTFFLSLHGAMEHARGEVTLRLDDLGNLVSPSDDEVKKTSL